MIPQWQDTLNRFSFSDSQKCKEKWHNLRSNYMRDRRKSKEKISGSAAMAKGKWPYYDILNFLEYYLQHRNMTGNFPQTTNATVSFTNPDETEMGSSEQLEGENIIHEQKMEGRSSKKEQPAGIKRGGKIQKLIAVDIGKQNLDSLKEIGNE
jgi:hypothetical protein